MSHRALFGEKIRAYEVKVPINAKPKETLKAIKQCLVEHDDEGLIWSIHSGESDLDFIWYNVMVHA